MSVLAGVLPYRVGDTRRPVDAYLHDLGRRLRGPRRLRRDLLDEARSGLEEAADDLAASGLDRIAAERAAVADFGPARQLAVEYQEELSLAQGRRTAMFAALVFPALTVAWQLVWIVPAGRVRSVAAPAYVYLLSSLTDQVSMVGMVIGVLALLVLRFRGTRRFAHPATVILGLLVLVTMLATLVMSVFMNLAHVEGYDAAVFSPYGLWVVGATVVAIALFVGTTYRSIRAGHAGFHLAADARRTA